MSKKLVIIGLDGMPKDLMELLIKEGKIPHLQKFIEKNSLKELKSTIPPTSFPAWPVMLTGKNQAEIGCFDTLSKKGYQYGTKSFSNLRNIWDELSDAGKTVGVINMPGTFPAKKLNGFMLTGIYTPSINDNCIYPESLRKELKEELNDYDFFPKYNNEREFMSKIIVLMKKRFSIIDKLYFKYQPDFFIFEESSTDWVQHCFSKYIHYSHHLFKNNRGYRELVFDYFELLDSLVGKFLNKLDTKTNVIIVSDHGSQPQKGKFFLNKLLEENGFLKLKSNLSLSLKIMKKMKIDDEKILHILSKIRIKKIISKILAGTKFNRKLVRSGGGINWNLAVKKNIVDWKNTKAFSMFAGFIYINLIDKENEGAVPKEEYDELRDKIIRDLKNNKKLDLVIYKKEELYEGKFIEDAPDLVVHEKSFQYWPSDIVSTTKFSIPLSKNAYHNGTHSLYGILTSNVSEISKNNLNVLDVGKIIREFFEIDKMSKMKEVIEHIKL